jgi:hypothetical protein
MASFDVLAVGVLQCGSQTFSSNVINTGASLDHPVPANLGATGVIPATALVNGYLNLTPGPSAYTMPTAAAVVTAFADSGVTLKVGDSFVVRAQNLHAANAGTIVASATIAAINTSVESVAAGMAVSVRFVVSQITPTAALLYTVSISS